LRGSTGFDWIPSKRIKPLAGQVKWTLNTLNLNANNVDYAPVALVA